MELSQLAIYLQQIELKWKVLLLLYPKINPDRCLWLIVSTSKTKPNKPTSTAPPASMTDGRMSAWTGKGGSSAGVPY